MVEIPADIQIKALICSGRTYLFKAQEHRGDVKHFHVVLNSSPKNDNSIVMVTATSIDLEQAAECWTDLAKAGVIVQAVIGDADFIQHPTFFRCDVPIVMSKGVIIAKLEDGSLVQKGIVTEPLLGRLRSGLVNSKTVAEEIKAYVRR